MTGHSDTLLKTTFQEPLTALQRKQLELEDRRIWESEERLRAFASALADTKSRSTADDAHRKRAHAALSRSPVAQRLWTFSVPSVTAYLEARRKEATSGRAGKGNTAHAVRPLIGLDMQHAAIVTLRCLLDGMQRERKAVSLATRVGASVFTERACLAWAREPENRRLVKSVLAKFKTDSTEHHVGTIRALAANSGRLRNMLPPLDEQIAAGTWLTYHVVACTGFFEEIAKRSNGRTTRYLRPTKELLDHIRKDTTLLALMRPIYGPLLIPPRDWARGQNGGFHYGLANTAPFSASGFLLGRWEEAEAVRDSCGPEPIACLNAHQQTAWRINRKVFEVFEEGVLNGGYLGGLPGFREQAAPPQLANAPSGHPKTWPDEWKERLKARNAKAAKIHEGNLERRHAAVRATATLAVAREFLEEPEFYFACNYDFRGRLYYLSPALNPQSSHEGRALLEFAQGVEPTPSAMRALMLHGASRWGQGVDKLPFDQREQWVRERDADIRGVAHDWRACAWWEKADDPWEFLAFCFAWADTSRSDLIHLPLQLDGSTNTFQHFAAASRDVDLAEATACRPRAANAPADLYGHLSARSLAAKGANLRLRDSRGRQLTPERLLTRSSAKKVILTIPYGGQPGAMVLKVAKELERLPLDKETRFTASKQIVKALLAELDASFPVVTRTAAFLRQLTKAANALSIDLAWVTPSGFPVSQAYRVATAEDKARLTVRFQNSVKKETQVLVRPPSKMNAKKAEGACIANVMHSLDAAHLHKTMARLGPGFGSIHDCILLPADRWEETNRVLREEFVNTHRAPFLVHLLEETRRLVGDHVQLPEVPALGEWNLEEVLESEFFFH